MIALLFPLHALSMTTLLRRPGVCAPLGFWDPAGFYKEASAERKLFIEEAIQNGATAVISDHETQPLSIKNISLKDKQIPHIQ